MKGFPGMNFNPRPPRGGRRWIAIPLRPSYMISIHAPREGGDSGGRSGRGWRGVFQSTPPARGATQATRPNHKPQKDFNPRPPRGGRPALLSSTSTGSPFQSTPPARGATLCVAFTVRIASLFQSTPPARGATPIPGRKSPCLTIFQSTPPARGATSRFFAVCAVTRIISIHAPREGGDPHQAGTAHHQRISIHAPREGGDCLHNFRGNLYCPFQSTPPARGATTIFQVPCGLSAYFNPRPPRGGRRGLCRLQCFIVGFQSTPPARGATPDDLAAD